MKTNRKRTIIFSFIMGVALLLPLGLFKARTMLREQSTAPATENLASPIPTEASVNDMPTTSLATHQTSDHCIDKDLVRFRSGAFVEQLAESPAAAADALRTFIDNDCIQNKLDEAIDAAREQLTGEMPSTDGDQNAALKTIENYLWAESDLAYAYLKSDRYAECIRISEQRLNEYYTNLLEGVKNQKLKKAFQTNLKRCDERRTTAFPKATWAPCSFSLKDRSVELFDVNKKTSVPITAVTTSLQVPHSSSCVALVEVHRPWDDALTGAQPAPPVPYLVHAREARTSAIDIITSINDNGDPTKDESDMLKCGDFKLEAYAGPSQEPWLRLFGGFSACEGSAKGNYDAIFAFKNDQFEKKDDASVYLH